MIIVHGIIPIKPDRREEALQLARDMSEATQTEDGCVSYDFYVGLRDPYTLVLLQEWDSVEAWMGHFRTAHMKAFLDELPHVVDGEIITRRYAVQAVDESDAEFVADDDIDDDVSEEVGDTEHRPIVH